MGSSDGGYDDRNLLDIVGEEIARAHTDKHFVWEFHSDRPSQIAPNGEAHTLGSRILIKLGWLGSYSSWLGARRVLEIELDVTKGETKSDWTTFTVGDDRYITPFVLAQLRAAGVKPTQAQYGSGFGNT
ncbi:MAG: hypothetical protein HYT16_02450 [DPANN group archaeon]|nr:hypothetical protein [DPANN group archaeon]